MTLEERERIDYELERLNNHLRDLSEMNERLEKLEKAIDRLTGVLGNLAYRM